MRGSNAVLVALGLSAALAITACGSGGTTAGPAGSGTPAAGASTPAAAGGPAEAGSPGAQLPAPARNGIAATAAARYGPARGTAGGQARRAAHTVRSVRTPRSSRRRMLCGPSVSSSRSSAARSSGDSVDSMPPRIRRRPLRA